MLAVVATLVVAGGCVTTTRRVSFDASKDCIRQCQDGSLACATDEEKDPPSGQTRWSYATHSTADMRGCQDALTRCVTKCDREAPRGTAPPRR